MSTPLWKCFTFTHASYVFMIYPGVSSFTPAPVPKELSANILMMMPFHFHRAICTAWIIIISTAIPAGLAHGVVNYPYNDRNYTACLFLVDDGYNIVAFQVSSYTFRWVSVELCRWRRIRERIYLSAFSYNALFNESVENSITRAGLWWIPCASITHKNTIMKHSNCTLDMSDEFSGNAMTSRVTQIYVVILAPSIHIHEKVSAVICQLFAT